jgi:hypothetical protein
MHEASKNPDTTAHSEVVRISRAIRFFFAAIVLGLSYPNIHCALGIGHFQQIYSDMLGNKPLAAATVFMVQHQYLFVGLSILFPIVAVATIFTPGITRPIYIAGVLIFAIFAQLFFSGSLSQVRSSRSSVT